MRLKNVFSIIAMLLVVFITGCKKDEVPTGVRPTVTFTAPENQVTSFSVSGKISATFSKVMNPSTVTVASFTLYQGADKISGTVECADTTATFTPAVNLAPNTIYTANITAGAKDLSGLSLVKNYTWSFTTGNIPDITKPSVTLTVPANSAIGVIIGQPIVITFSELMDLASITSLTFTLNQGTTSVTGAISFNGKTTTFTPNNNLEYNKVYTGTITTGAKDVEGNAMASNYNFSFTTVNAPDVISPIINSTDPANNATGVAIDKLIATTFSEQMDLTTINSLTFTLNQGTISVAGAVTYTGTTASFKPASNLENNKVYTGTITTGAKDLAGNALISNHTFSFTTIGALDIVLPTVNSTDPLNNATSVQRNQVVAITFSEAMDPITINASTFTLIQGTNVVSGTIAYSGTTATFTPQNILESGMTYTATITTDAKDIAGNALAVNTVWSFTTSIATSGLAAVELGSAGNYLILAKTAISNISTSAITGDLGLSPAATSYITGLSLTDATGYATSAQVTGKVYAADMADPTPMNLTTAVENMITAYNDAAGRPNPDFLELSTGNIGGKTLTPGLYKWTNTVTLPSDVTISGGANDVWIFQISGDLLMDAAVRVTLVGGAQAKNIFWQVAGQATFGTTSHFEGIILSMTGVTFQTGASMNGRVLAQTAVALDSNAVTLP